MLFIVHTSAVYESFTINYITYFPVILEVKEKSKYAAAYFLGQAKVSETSSLFYNTRGGKNEFFFYLLDEMVNTIFGKQKATHKLVHRLSLLWLLAHILTTY